MYAGLSFIIYDFFKNDITKLIILIEIANFILYSTI